MRTFLEKISKVTSQCDRCGLVSGLCICPDEIRLISNIEFWLLTHENELSRTTNTGRLIENTFKSTKVFKWSRTNPPKDLLEVLDANRYQVFLIMSADRPSEKARQVAYVPCEKQTVFLILDGTWKEVRKMLRKSSYLNHLPILSLDVNEKSLYNLRRNTDSNHICTVEVGVALLKMVGEGENAGQLDQYFNTFLSKYHKGRNYQGGDLDDHKNL